MKVCVVWEMVPEETRVYVEEVPPELVDKIKNTHQTYINVNDNDDTNWLAEWLDGKTPVTEPVEDVGLVVVSGFMM